jgi:hypothetical protein
MHRGLFKEMAVPVVLRGECTAATATAVAVTVVVVARRLGCFVLNAPVIAREGRTRGDVVVGALVSGNTDAAATPLERRRHGGGK